MGVSSGRSSAGADIGTGTRHVGGAAGSQALALCLGLRVWGSAPGPHTWGPVPWTPLPSPASGAWVLATGRAPRALHLGLCSCGAGRVPGAPHPPTPPAPRLCSHGPDRWPRSWGSAAGPACGVLAAGPMPAPSLYPLTPVWVSPSQKHGTALSPS